MSATVSSVLVIMGPTASGKSAAAIELAERFDAEIVGADSRQIYRDMPIGTAAPTEADRARVRHHLVAFLDPHERYSAARFVDDATRAIAQIHACGRRAIVVGGTGFYVRALCGDVTLAREFDPEIRARVDREARVHPQDVLHAWLAVRDPERARGVPSGDTYRTVRALEIALARRAPRAAPVRSASLRASATPFCKVLLDIDDATLERRIEARVDAMLVAGLIDEAERTGAEAVAAGAIGYPQVLAYLAGLSSRVELRASLVRATRRYAKRQRTWFRSEPGIVPCAADRLEALARGLPGWA